MDYDLIRYAALILLGILFYAVLARGLFNATEPYRVGALEIAERLTHSTQVAPKRKEFLNERLGEVYSNWQAWKLLALVICILPTLPFRNNIRNAERADKGIPSHLRADYDRFKGYWMVSTVANSPAAALLFAVITLIATAFFASVSAISGSLAFARDDHGPDSSGTKHA